MFEPAYLEIRDRSLGGAILRDERFVAFDFGAFMRDITARYGAKFGVNLDATATLLHHLPFFLVGETHQARRETQAKVLQGLRGQHMHNLTAYFAANPVRLEPDQDVDVLNSVLVPALNAMWADHVRLPDALQLVMRDGQEVFRFDTPMRKRIAMDARLKAAMDAAKTDHPDWLDHFALYLIGRSTLVSSFALELWEIFSAHPDKMLCDMPFGTEPQETTVKHVARVLHEPADVAGCPFKANQAIKIYLDPRETGTPPDRFLNLFGAGIRSCLGRSLALYFWRALADQMRRNRVFVTPHQTQRPKIAHQFDGQTELWVSVHDHGA